MPEIGFNYRLSDVNCALGLSQLRKLDRFISARAALVAYYDRRLAELPSAIMPILRTSGCSPAWHLYPVLIDFAALGATRGALMRALRAQGIGSQVHYIPVHRQPYYRRRYGDVRLPGAEYYYSQTLSLPLYVGMTTADVDRVIDALVAFIGHSGARSPRRLQHSAP